MRFPHAWVLSSFCFLSMSCISYHVIMCIAFAYVFISCIRAFSLLSVLQFDTPTSSGAPFCLFSCAGVELSRNGSRFAKRPWYTTGRPPVKFRAIWSPFDTPTVNRGTVKASCVLQPNTPPKWPNNPSILSAVQSRSRGRKSHLIWTLLAPSTYIFAPPPEISQCKP